MGKVSKVHASLSLATLERQKQKVHFDTRYCRSGAQTPSQNSWQNLPAAFSFGIYFAVLACSWSVGSPAEQSHQTGMIISCVHNQWPLCTNSVPRRASADGYNTLFVLLFSFLPLLLFTSLSFQVLTSWRPSGSSCSRWCIQTAHPAVKPLCSPRFHNCCGFGENILHCKVQTHSSCLKISEQNLLWDSAWDTRLVTINREMLKVLPPLLALQKVEGWCDVKVEGPTHSWEPAVVKMKRKMCPKPYYSLASRKIAEKMEFCRSGRIRGNMKLLDSESVRGQSPNNENNPCFQWILLKVFLLRKG